MRVAVVAGPNPASAFPAAALALSLTDNGDDVLVLTGRRWLERLHSSAYRPRSCLSMVTPQARMSSRTTAVPPKPSPSARHQRSAG